MRTCYLILLSQHSTSVTMYMNAGHHMHKSISLHCQLFTGEETLGLRVRNFLGNDIT